MQHDHIQIFFLPFHPTQGMVFYAPFPLISYATQLLSEKKIVLTFEPTPGVEGVCKDRIISVHVTAFAI